MALIKFGAGVVDMRGSIAGTVFSRNASGAYARARTAPVNTNTERQSIIRAAIQNLVSRWQNVLNPGQREAWALYAANITMQNRLGESILLSGFNHYIRSNSIRVNESLGVRDAGPTNLTLPAGDPLFEVTASYGAQTLSVAFDDTQPWASEDSAHMIVSMSQPKNSAVNFIGNPFRIAGVIDGDSAAPITSPQVIGSLPYTISVDQVIGAKARISRDDSRLTNFFSDPRIPTTA